MIKYVAFLRGINVGGHKAVKMEELKKAFATLGLENVKTLLASGNVLFAAPAASESALAQKIEKKLETAFGHEIGVLIRKLEGLQRLAEADPFAGIKVTPQTRLYVTFLAEKPKSGLKIPYESPDQNFKIIRATASVAGAIFHLMFWKLFRWKEDLASLSIINRAVMQILNLCLTFVFLIFAYISNFHAAELLTTKIGKALLLLIAVFWFLRAIEQIVFFRLKTNRSMAFFVVFVMV